MNSNEDPKKDPSTTPIEGLQAPGKIHKHVTRPKRTASPSQLLAGRSVAGSALSTRETITALLSAPGFAQLAAALPDPQRPRRGRKAPHPAEMYLLFEQLCELLGDQTRVEAELRDPAVWAFICEQLKTRFDLDMPADKPLQRRQMQTWRSYITVESLETNVRPVLRAQGFEMNRAMEMLIPTGEVDWTNPSPDNTLSGDGTWLKPWSTAAIVTRKDGTVVVKNSRATKIERVRQADGSQSFKKDGRVVEGRGYVAFHTRTNVAGERIVVDIAPIPPGTGEIGTARRMIEQLIAEADGGVHAVTYDGAYDAADLVGLMELGVLPVVPVPSSSSPATMIVPPELERMTAPKRHKDRDDTPAKPKHCRFAPLKTVAHPDHHGVRCEHHLYAYDGEVVDAVKNGTKVRARYLCPMVSRHRTSAGDGYRFSLTVEVPCPHGSFTVSINPHGFYDRGRPVASALRMVALSHPDYRRLTGRRNDTESYWAWMKSTMRNRRSPRLDAGDEYLHILAVATAWNAIAYYRFNQTGGAK